MVEEGATSPEVIDELMRSAGQFRMGPLELIDLIGVEVNLAVTRTVWQAYNFDPRFAPSHAKRAGRRRPATTKLGHGFYRYGEDVERTTPEHTRSHLPGIRPPQLHGRSGQLEALLTRAEVPTMSFPPGRLCQRGDRRPRRGGAQRRWRPPSRKRKLAVSPSSSSTAA